MAEQGIPTTFRTDKGPQFSSQSFRKFAEEYGFNHVTSSPYYSHSDGFIESQVKIAKHALSKAAKSDLDLALALLCLRATTVDSHSKSPAELLFGQQLQDNLPQLEQRLEDDYFQHLHKKQDQQKLYHDHHHASYSPVVPGQSVLTRNPTTSLWEPAAAKSYLGLRC